MPEYNTQTHDLIIGIHSIAEAIKNPHRTICELYVTKRSKEELSKVVDLRNIEVKVVDQHRIQEEGKKYYKMIGKEYRRIPSEMFLYAEALPFHGVAELYSDIESGKPLKIFCLDQVTDVHNGAAIFRTAAFYGVDYIVLSQKGNFGLTPSFFRTASGGIEHVKLVQCSNLAKTITKMQGLGVMTLGFMEAGEKFTYDLCGKPICLVMGAEDKGLSNAVKRVVEYKVSLDPIGKISTLNVSVASAIAMEKFFS